MSVCHASDAGVEAEFNSFKTGIFDTMEKNILECSTRKFLPWFNRKLKRMSRRKAHIYKYAKKTSCFKRNANGISKKAEIKFINETIEKGVEENNTQTFV